MATALALTAGGCVTVHGELAVVPSVTKAEAAKTLREFTAAYNAADKAHDPDLDAAHVTGALGAINQAGLTSRGVTYPEGNPQHSPLELTDAEFAIPKKAGWPRFFVADADSNRDRDDSAGDNRWLIVFLRTGPDDAWQAAYLTILFPRLIPELKTDEDGFAEPVALDSTALAHAPRDLGEKYASYLETGKPEVFEDGPHTSGWRDSRKKEATRPGRSKQYLDEPLNRDDYAPLALATEDGGALAFFTVRNFERETAAKGVRIAVHPDVKALLRGEVHSSLTKERVSSQAVVVPPAGGGGKVAVLGRLTGLTSAKGA
ncbi:hypothetical protein [Streptomyces jumonjinensis]|uniref:DUF8094 domain-containing protein n=1 Tax=Streptomyces jumonjinensis TaxID=1945 RepID=A0A646KAE5_STRJU|nr:hypothetical protein [Streptomyces jumonjinensis]MQS99133.1 hypothetical protein [Streptomyces jumonjinensis]